jgi:hypothetical protein
MGTLFRLPKQTARDSEMSEEPKYRAFMGQWKFIPPGYQFETTLSRAAGAIWQDQEGKWFAQQYRGCTKMFKFNTREEAERYVKAADEESRLIAAGVCIAS